MSGLSLGNGLSLGSLDNVPSVTWANIPAPGNPGNIIRVSNFGTAGALLMDTGTRWVPVNGAALLSTMDTTSASIGNTATIVHQYLIPAGMLQLKDRLSVKLVMNKSGTTDTGVLRFYMGTAGTTADTQLVSNTFISAGNRAVATMLDFRLQAATTLQLIGTGNPPFGYSAQGSAASLAAFTISSAVANALYFSIGILSSSTNDTVTLLDAQISLIASTN